MVYPLRRGQYDMPMRQIVYLRESGRGIILYPSAYEARPNRVHARYVTTTSILELEETLSRYTQET
jgi:hypothetical protein